MPEPVFVRAGETSVFVRELDRPYPLIVRGRGRVAGGRAAAPLPRRGQRRRDGDELGDGRQDVDRRGARRPARSRSSTTSSSPSPAQEALADELTARRAGRPRPRALRHRRRRGERDRAAAGVPYHVERGEPERTRIVSPAQAYHGPTMATLGLTGRPGLWAPYEPFVAQSLYIPPSTWRFDPQRRGRPRRARRASPRTAARAPSPRSSAEPISAAALPGYSPPDAFWHGLDERRAEHGFLIVLDEVVTGLGSHRARGSRPSSCRWCRRHHDREGPRRRLRGDRRDAVRRRTSTTPSTQGSRAFEHGHTWDGAPLSCAVGRSRSSTSCAERGLVERVRERGPRAARRARRRARGLRPGPRGARPRLPAGRRVRRPAGRRVVPRPRPRGSRAGSTRRRWSTG